MITILIMVLGVLAIFSWGVALLSAVRIVGLAPKGQRLAAYGRLGWWNFEGVRALTGPGADIHIRNYQRAFIAFIVCVLVAIVAGTLVGAATQN